MPQTPAPHRTGCYERAGGGGGEGTRTAPEAAHAAHRKVAQHGLLALRRALAELLADQPLLDVVHREAHRRHAELQADRRRQPAVEPAHPFVPVDGAERADDAGVGLGLLGGGAAGLELALHLEPRLDDVDGVRRRDRHDRRAPAAEEGLHRRRHPTHSGAVTLPAPPQRLLLIPPVSYRRNVTSMRVQPRCARAAQRLCAFLAGLYPVSS